MDIRKGTRLTAKRLYKDRYGDKRVMDIITRELDNHQSITVVFLSLEADSDVFYQAITLDELILYYDKK